MIYNWICILCLTLLPIINAEEITLETCHCNEGYKPEKRDDGTIECVGINVYNTEACNIKNPPKCKCTGDVSSIVIDDKGTWCSATPKEGAPKLWPCENEDEWVAYKTTLEQEKRS